MNSFSNNSDEPNRDSTLALPPPKFDISNLPYEILISISNFIPDGDEQRTTVTCLALCNRHLYATFADQVTALPPQPQLLKPPQIKTLLTILCRDLPRHHFCDECYKIHRTHQGWQPHHTSNLHPIPPCLSPKPSLKFFVFSTFHLQLSHIRLAIKRHLHGPRHGIPLSSFETTEIFKDTRHPSTTLLSVEARIVNSQVFLRAQQWVFIPQDNFHLLFREGRNLVRFLCTHLEHQVEGWIKWTTVRTKKNGNQDITKLCTKKCKHCEMDYMLDVLHFGEAGMAVRIVWWVNVGNGQDEELKEGVYEKRGVSSSLRSHFTNSLRDGDHEVGSVRALFESRNEEEGGRSLVELNGRNQDLLFTKMEEVEFTRRKDARVWQWQGNDKFPHFKRWFIVAGEDVKSDSRIVQARCWKGLESRRTTADQASLSELLARADSSRTWDRFAMLDLRVLLSRRR